MLFPSSPKEDLWNMPKHTRWLPVTCGNKKALLDREGLNNSKSSSIYKYLKAAQPSFSRHYNIITIKSPAFVLFCFSLHIVVSK